MSPIANKYELKIEKPIAVLFFV